MARQRGLVQSATAIRHRPRSNMPAIGRWAAVPREQQVANIARAQANETASQVPLLSSRSRGWKGIVVELYRAANVDVVARFPETIVSLHLRGPVHLVQRRNGRAYQRTMHPGDVIVAPEGEPKQLQHEESAEIVKLRLSRELLAEVIQDGCGGDPEQVRLLDNFGTRDAQLEYVGRRFLAELETEGLGDRIFAESLARQLAVHLVRHYSTMVPGAACGCTRLPPHRLRKAIEFIDSNLHTDLSLEDIAQTVAMSPYHFAHLFKQTTGDSPHQYVMLLRLEHAKSLLRCTELPITEVAHRVGYASISHFASVFHRSTGLTPRQYRREI